MPVEHEKELRDFANRAANLAKKIHQEWGSAAPRGGLKEHVNVDMPKHGPDPELQKVERALGSAVAAIEAYLQRPPER